MDVVIKLENVLADFTKQFINWHNLEFDTDFETSQDVLQFSFNVMPLSDKLAGFIQSPYLTSLKPVMSYPDIAEIRRNVDSIHVISQIVTEGSDRLYDWLDSHYPYVLDDIVFISDYVEFCEDVGAEVLIDTRMNNSKKIRTVLYKTPYTNNPKAVDKIGDILTQLNG